MVAKLIAVAAGIAVLAGCGGSQAVAPRPSAPTGATAASPSAKATATLKVTIPNRTANANARRPQYVSPATQSIAVSFTPTPTGSTQTFNQNLTTGSPGCVASLVSPLICTVQFALAPGNYTATFTTYDGLLDGGNNPTGNVLSQNQSIAVVIAAGQANNINVTLQGVPASVALVPGATSTLTGSQGAGFGLSKCFANQSVSVIGVDADGNYIVGSGAPTPSLNSSDSTQLAVTAPTTSSPNTFTLSRPAVPNANATVSLTATATPGSGGGSALTSSIALTFDAAICGVFTEYPLPISPSFPTDITVGPDGALWFTEALDRIGRITVSGSLTEYAVSPGGSQPNGIVAGPDSALWFLADGGNYIGSVTTSGVFGPHYSVSAFSQPWAVASGSDGALWFTEAVNTGSVGRITTAGAITLFFVGGSPLDIVSGADGALWFADNSGSNIGRITTGGVVTEYATPTANSFPVGVAVGANGDIWFTEEHDQIGHLVNGSITEFAVTAGSTPWRIVRGPDGAMWFTENSGGRIGRITSGGSVTEYTVPTSNAHPQGIKVGPDGALWFVESVGNKVGRLQ